MSIFKSIYELNNVYFYLGKLEQPYLFKSCAKSWTFNPY